MGYDPNFATTKLLIPCAGANGSTTFTDFTGKTVTAYGNAQISTAQSKYNGSSALFDGNGDYLSIPHSTDLNLVTGDFTIEGWFKLGATGILNILIEKDMSASPATNMSWAVYVNSSNKLVGGVGNGTASAYVQELVGGTTLNTTNWHHFAFVRSGTTLYLFLDGSLDVAAATQSGTPVDAGRSVIIGWCYSTYYFNGNLEDIRVKKEALYTENFTPPTEALPTEPYPIPIQPLPVTGQLAGIQSNLIHYSGV